MPPASWAIPASFILLINTIVYFTYINTQIIETGGIEPPSTALSEQRLSIRLRLFYLVHRRGVEPRT